MKFIVITHIMYIEEKRAIFFTEYQRIINEKYTLSLQLYTTLKEHLEPKYFTLYDQKLRTLVETLQIKIYANNVIEELVKELSQVSTPTNYMPYVKAGIIVIVSLAVVLGGIAIIRCFIDNSAVIETATLAKETALLSTEGQQMQQEAGLLIQNLVQQTAQLTMAGTRTNEIVTNLTIKVEQMHKDELIIKALITRITNTLKEKNIIAYANE